MTHATCYWENEQGYDDPATDSCRLVEGTQDAHAISMRFWCDEGWDGYELDVYMYQKAWGFDNHIFIGTVTEYVAFQIYEIETYVPDEWVTCDPEDLYLQVYYNILYSYESCKFLPQNIHDALECDSTSITNPGEGELIQMEGGPQDVHWNLQSPDAWSGWNLEFYLYHKLSFCPDPYWLLGDTLATDLIMSWNPSDLQLNTNQSAEFYITAFWRDSWVGLLTFESATSPQFHFVDDHEYQCRISIDSTAIDLSCCASNGDTSNDLCRLSPGALSIEVVDLYVDVPYNPDDPCLADISISTIISVIYISQEDGGVVENIAEYTFQRNIHV